MRLGMWLFLGVLLLCGVMPAGAARITATTRNRSVSKETVTVAKNGAALLPVIIAAQADPQTRADAEDLIGYLGTMTGATFPLKPGGAGPGIYVGTLTEFPTPSAAEGLKIYDYFDGKEAYAIRTERGSIKLLGATPQGVGYAVSRFLELLGCRFFFQSPVWEVTPASPTLTFNRNETDRPEVLTRYFGYPLTQQYEKDDPDAGKLLRTWWKRNRVGKSLQTRVGHVAHEIVARYKDEFAAHPEYRALLADGTRTGANGSIWGQLCVSNPAVVQLGIQYAREWLDKHPDADMVGAGPDDGGGYCTCAECAARWPNPGDQAFYFANEIAKALQQSHPGKMVGLYAYNWHCDPPEGFVMEPNVYVELTTALLLNTKYGFDELLVRWPKQCTYFGLYDYWAVYDWIRDRLPSGRTGNLRYVAEQLPRYVKHGICNLSAESGNSWGSQGLGYYLAARVLWDSSTDTAALTKDFYAKAFGPAAAAMRTYYERVDAGNKPLVGVTFNRLCLDDLAKAEKAAQGRPDVLARIEQLKQYHVFLYLLHKTHQPGVDLAARKPYALELLKWNYRLRNSYMTFWSFFADQTTKQLSETFQEESWWWWKMHSQRKGDEIPYRDPAAVISAADTNRWIATIAAEYGDAPTVEEITFSNDLVLPNWEALGQNTKLRGYPPTQGYLFQGYCSPVALVSVEGEPLRLTIRQGTLYKNMPEGAYVLTDVKGKEVARERVPNGETVLELPVPAAGVYTLRYTDHAAGFALVPGERQQGGFVLERGEPMKAYNHISCYFYVPKGTKTIYLYANKSGAEFGICRPDGVWVGEAKPGGSAQMRLRGDGAYLAIPVPEQMDGKVWSALTLNRGAYWFFNIPNVLAFSPAGVPVPREVAIKDGLIPPPPAKGAR